MRYAFLYLTLVATPLAAQTSAPPSLTPAPHAVAIPDSARRYPPTHWKTGLIAGAAVGAFLGAGLAGGLCGLRETDSPCVGATLGGALVIGAAGGTLGALIGSLFRRAPPDSNDP